uniref:Uncharacterized protein n=1 Tax=Arundo donax TaxID=35708 RepID=A0A0A9GFR1_ARUDO
MSSSSSILALWLPRFAFPERAPRLSRILSFRVSSRFSSSSII